MTSAGQIERMVKEDIGEWLGEEEVLCMTIG
jgi:hypothetical protein